MHEVYQYGEQFANEWGIFQYRLCYKIFPHVIGTQLYFFLRVSETCSCFKNIHIWFGRLYIGYTTLYTDIFELNHHTHFKYCSQADRANHANNAIWSRIPFARKKAPGKSVTRTKSARLKYTCSGTVVQFYTGTLYQIRTDIVLHETAATSAAGSLHSPL